MGRLSRWIVSVGGAAVLLQTGPCVLTNAEAAREFVRQFVVPQVASVLSDMVFFVLDNAFVHLTT